MERFGILVLCYEFDWSLAELQARRQMCREKMARNNHVHSALNLSFVAESREGSR